MKFRKMLLELRNSICYNTQAYPAPVTYAFISPEPYSPKEVS